MKIPRVHVLKRGEYHRVNIIHLNQEPVRPHVINIRIPENFKDHFPLLVSQPRANVPPVYFKALSKVVHGFEDENCLGRLLLEASDCISDADEAIVEYYWVPDKEMRTVGEEDYFVFSVPFVLVHSVDSVRRVNQVAWTLLAQKRLPLTNVIDTKVQ